MRLIKTSLLVVFLCAIALTAAQTAVGDSTPSDSMTVSSAGNGSAIGTCSVTTSGVPDDVTGLASSTHAIQANWYSNNTPAFSWNTANGATGYSYVLDQTSGTTPDTTPPTVSFVDPANHATVVLTGRVRHRARGLKAAKRCGYSLIPIRRVTTAFPFWSLRPSRM